MEKMITNDHGCNLGTASRFLLGFAIVNSGAGDMGILLMTCGLGAVAFPILTYTVTDVNRFVLGFLFGTKFVALITTVMFSKKG